MVYLYLCTAAYVEVILSKQVVCLTDISCGAVFYRKYAVVSISVFDCLKNIGEIGIKAYICVGEQLYRSLLGVASCRTGTSYLYICLLYTSDAADKA